MIIHEELSLYAGNHDMPTSFTLSTGDLCRLTSNAPGVRSYETYMILQRDNNPPKRQTKAQLKSEHRQNLNKIIRQRW